MLKREADHMREIFNQPAKYLATSPRTSGKTLKSWNGTGYAQTKTRRDVWRWQKLVGSHNFWGKHHVREAHNSLG